MKLDKQIFKHFSPNIENIPFSDIEVCNVLGISSARLSDATKLGLVQKSASIHYRHDFHIYFSNIFDIFEYALRCNFAFLCYRDHSEVSELVLSLVDEFTLIIDNCNSTISCPKLNCVKADVISACMYNSEKWAQYWLYDGEPFSSMECSNITLRTWYEIFDKTEGIVRSSSNPPICHGARV